MRLGTTAAAITGTIGIGGGFLVLLMAARGPAALELLIQATWTDPPD